jgi:hypothetical protein
MLSLPRDAGGAEHGTMLHQTPINHCMKHDNACIRVENPPRDPRVDLIQIDALTRADRSPLDNLMMATRAGDGNTRSSEAAGCGCDRVSAKPTGERLPPRLSISAPCNSHGDAAWILCHSYRRPAAKLRGEEWQQKFSAPCAKVCSCAQNHCIHCYWWPD